jgi:hypothetical protein
VHIRTIARACHCDEPRLPSSWAISRPSRHASVAALGPVQRPAQLRDSRPGQLGACPTVIGLWRLGQSLSATCSGHKAPGTESAGGQHVSVPLPPTRTVTGTPDGTLPFGSGSQSPETALAHRLIRQSRGLGQDRDCVREHFTVRAGPRSIGVGEVADVPQRRLEHLAVRAADRRSQGSQIRLAGQGAQSGIAPQSEILPTVPGWQM